MLQFIGCVLMKNVVAYNMIKKENNMNNLNCKVCDTPTGSHDDDVVAVTCSICSMVDVVSLLKDMDSEIVGIA